MLTSILNTIGTESVTPVVLADMLNAMMKWLIR